VALKGGAEKGREEVSGLLGFMALVCVKVYFCCYSGRCLCQELQGAGGVNSWYSRLVSGSRLCRRER
jgi:hypothetical protein